MLKKKDLDAQISDLLQEWRELDERPSGTGFGRVWVIGALCTILVAIPAIMVIFAILGAISGSAHEDSTSPTPKMEVDSSWVTRDQNKVEITKVSKLLLCQPPGT